MNNKVKIFDCLAHPTISSKWGTLNKPSKKLNSSFKLLQKEMKINNVFKACAIGIDKFEKYDHRKFVLECKKYRNLIPIAGFNPIQTKKNILKEIKLIKKLGFKGVKLHPRISDFNLTDKKLPYSLKVLNDNNLIVFLCTYPPFSKNKKNNSFFDQLVSLLSKLKSFKIVLVHGGLTKVLEYSELVRSYPNKLLLDLSPLP